MDSYRYNRYSAYLKDRFNTRVHRVSVDAGFSCPNIDGKISSDGCIYCDNRAFSFQKHKRVGDSLETQIQEGIDFSSIRFDAKKYIIYFQAHTNTYADIKTLKQKFDVVKKFDNIVGFAVATRPDCVDEKVLDLIESYSDGYEVTVEYGVQSIHNNTLEYINRGHKYADFLKAYEITSRRKLRVSAHVILGLPFETDEMIEETALAMGCLKLDEIKIHPLHIIKGTKLEKIFLNNEFNVLSFDRYVDLLIMFLECLYPKTVVNRLSAWCPKGLLVAPDWISEKNKVESIIEYRLKDKGSCQGMRWKEKI
ncbi:MAG: TIGR01212 family radical SAM protein [Candidatus Omnitrophota bacterium]